MLQYKLNILSHQWSEHELLDSGNRLKLERFGNITLIRSEPKAWWNIQNKKLWDNADCEYLDEGKLSNWKFYTKFKAPILDYKGVKFSTKFMDGSKHIGIFPEQEPHWDYIYSQAQDFIKTHKKKPSLLNLFGYTGAASLIAAKGGYTVTHVDASKPSVDWAKKNQIISGLEDKPIRWIIDDALKFVKREVRRGNKYDAIILDPPAFGRGPKNELWKLEKMLPELMDSCSKLISDTPLFVIATLYSIDASSIMAGNVLHQYFSNSFNNFEVGELSLNPKNSYTLPLSIYAKAY